MHALALTVGLALGCGAAAAGAEPQYPEKGEPDALAHELEVLPGDPLLSYAWDGGAQVPAPPPARSIRIPYGEHGVTDSTRVYLPFHSDEPDAGLGLSTAGELRCTVVERNTRWTTGVFGSALEFPGSDSNVSVVAEEGALFGQAWSLEFWVRLSPTDQSATLVSVPGLLRIFGSSDGYLRVALAGDSVTRLRSSTPLLPAAWNHVGVAYGGPDFPQLRFSLNGGANGTFTECGAGASEIRAGGFVGALDDLSISDFPATSAGFEEHWQRVVTPGFHSLELRYAQHTEELRLWAGALEQPRLGAPAGADWQQGALEHAANRAGALTWTPGHWERYRTAREPLPRTTHPTIYVGDHRVFLFGGETRDSHVGGMLNTNDTWIFRTDTGEWIESRSKTAPPPSCHQSAAYSPDHGVVLYAGGQFNEKDEFRNYNQTWLYFVEEDRWERRRPAGDRLPRFSNGATVYLPLVRQFLMLVRTTMYLYDPEADRWTRLPDTESVTSNGTAIAYEPGGSPMAGYDPLSGGVLFFGGGVGRESRRTVDTWQDTTALFDPATGTHSVFDTPLAPPGRVRAGFAYDTRRERFVLFGGVLDQMSQRMRDLWSFHPASGQWKRMDASNPPSERGGFYHMAYDPDLDRCVLLCGRVAPGRFSNEAWALSLDESATGSATYVFDRRGFPGLDCWFAEWNAPGGSRVTFRFRSGTDGLTWDSWSPTLAAGAEDAWVQVEVQLHPGGPDSVPTIRSMGFADSSAATRAGEHGERRAVQRIEPLRD